MPGLILLHTVLISFRDSASPEERKEVFDRYQTLAEDCGGIDAGILFWSVQDNMDLRKNVHLVEVALFTGPAALEAFRVHPKHREFTGILSRIADWQVGDIMIDPSLP